MSHELFKAASVGDFEKIKHLIDEGCDLNYRDEHGNSVLGCGDIKMTEFLLTIGADPAIPSYNNHSAAGIAAFFGEYDRIKILLDAGADPNQVREETGESPLHLATCKINKPGTTQCVGFLLSYGADPNHQALEGVGSDCFNGNLWVVAETPLHRAAAYGEMKMNQLLLEHGGDISLKDCYGYLPLDWAARMWRDHDVLRLLGGSV